MAPGSRPSESHDPADEADFSSYEAPGPRSRWRRSMGSGGRSLSVVGFDFDSFRARVKRLFRR